MVVKDIGDTEIRLIGTDTELNEARCFVRRVTTDLYWDADYSFGLGPDDDAVISFRRFETAAHVSALLHSAKIIFGEDNDS